MAWLAQHQNNDGGWGDTVNSLSNISTTMLCRAALHITGSAAEQDECLHRAEHYLQKHFGQTPEEHIQAVRARYGKDRTFSVPILMTCALAGLVPWSEVSPLPFELACLPQSWFRFLRLPVVSYALPALIAIGQTIYHHRRPKNLIVRIIRHLARKRSLRVLQSIQPSSGGFLEATPLTSFVTMALASCGQADHPVTRLAVEFLVKSVRPDGSWPIDTNLATWVTTLAINALAAAGEIETLDRRAELMDWLLGQQLKQWHPYTGSRRGGWGWTDLPGSVPDADDTAGALLALHALDPGPDWFRKEFGNEMTFGIVWLLYLHNRDGGWPTFCRGWGHLPFDRSGADLTAHVLRAFHVCFPHRSLRHIQRGITYLQSVQRPDGSWLPLWFGNQHVPGEENPTYGTARVLAAYRDLHMMDSGPARRGVDWLLRAQSDDGGWGGAAGAPCSIEETALAVEILLDATPSAETAVNKGVAWLIERVERGGLKQPTPIGFYFAKLWYYEKLYPVIFTVAALGRARQSFLRRQDSTRQTSSP